jgi:hypothetical protein
MNRQDQELLDKQLRAISPAPQHEGAVLLTAMALFVAGIALGNWLSGPENAPMPMQTASYDAAVAGAHGPPMPSFR